MAFNYDLDRLKEIMQSFHSLTGLRLNIFDSDCNRLFAYPNVYCKFCEYVRSFPKPTKSARKATDAPLQNAVKRTDLLYINATQDSPKLLHL